MPLLRKGLPFLLREGTQPVAAAGFVPCPSRLTHWHVSQKRARTSNLCRAGCCSWGGSAAGGRPSSMAGSKKCPIKQGLGSNVIFRSATSARSNYATSIMPKHCAETSPLCHSCIGLNLWNLCISSLLPWKKKGMRRLQLCLDLVCPSN